MTPQEYIDRERRRAWMNLKRANERRDEKAAERLAEKLEVLKEIEHGLKPTATREQVEKVWRTHWVSVDSGRVSRCAHCGFEALYPEIYTFCPDCGRPFTDYAVDILLKRFEVLKDGKKAD